MKALATMPGHKNIEQRLLYASAFGGTWQCRHGVANNRPSCSNAAGLRVARQFSKIRIRPVNLELIADVAHPLGQTASMPPPWKNGGAQKEDACTYSSIKMAWKRPDSLIAGQILVICSGFYIMARAIQQCARSSITLSSSFC